MDTSKDSTINIAILVGTASYDKLLKLPACDHDIAKMKSLLDATDKYQSVEVITDSKSDIVKDQIRGIFSRNKGAKVGELFFYFSGHGTYERDDVLLCCGDFDEKTPTSTSISNREIDDLIRSISPDLTVKVIDACRSGAQYIKDTSSGFAKAMNESKSKFNSFYCMSSSQLDQSSYASSDISHFTQKFIEGALRKDSGTVFYRDIQAYIADSFASAPDQTPFFVHQGSGLEHFANIGSKMTGLKSANMSSSPQETIDSETETDKKLAQLNSLYVPKTAVDNALVESLELLQAEKIHDPLVKKYYSINVESSIALQNLVDIRVLAKWAAGEGFEKKYFIRLHRESYTPKKETSGTMSFSALVNGVAAAQVKQRVHSISSLHKLPFETIFIYFRAPSNPSLRTMLLRIALLHSRTEVMILTSIQPLALVGWDEEKLEVRELNWSYETIPWKDVVSNPKLIWQEAFEDGISHVRDHLLAITGQEQKERTSSDKIVQDDPGNTESSGH